MPDLLDKLKPIIYYSQEEAKKLMQTLSEAGGNKDGTIIPCAAAITVMDTLIQFARSSCYNPLYYKDHGGQIAAFNKLEAYLSIRDELAKTPNSRIPRPTDAEIDAQPTMGPVKMPESMQPKMWQPDTMTAAPTTVPDSVHMELPTPQFKTDSTQQKSAPTPVKSHRH